MLTDLTEGSLCRIKSVISARRHQNVKAIAFDVVKIVFALRVRHCETVLPAIQGYCDTSHWISICIDYRAANRTTRRGWRVPVRNHERRKRCCRAADEPAGKTGSVRFINQASAFGMQHL